MKLRITLPLSISLLALALVAQADDGAKKGGKEKAAPPKGQGMPKMPPPPKEIKEAMKAGWSGNWKCQGQDLMMNMPVKGVMTFKSDLAGYWISATWKQAKMKGMPAMTMQEKRTYDSAKSQWVAMSVDSFGGWGTSIGSGKPGSKLTWEGDMTVPGMGTMKMRMHEEPAGPKAMKVWAEASQDGGTTYNKAWEANCKR